jgi:hypothetical protein
MLDRLLHRSVTVNIRGPSYRLKDRLRSGAPLTVPGVGRKGGEI